jgi:RNA exonuclease 1
LSYAFKFPGFLLGSYGLARVAVVDENLKTLYHTYVKPDMVIADYLNRFSGIAEELLVDVKKTPSDVQQDFQYLLPPDAILVGQSLQSDLKALKVRRFSSKKNLFNYLKLMNRVYT